MRAQKNRIVIVVTSHSELGDTGKKTGYHLEELAVPYLEFKRSGAEIVIASPKGGQPPVDPKSAAKESAASQEFLNDPEASRLLRNSTKVDDVEGNIDVLFFPGGHGPMWDLASSPATTNLIEAVWRDGGVIGALCHGPAALINAKDEEGKPLVSGRKVNSYTDEEEKAGELYNVIPFHLEAKLRELGAKFESSPKQQAHVVRDGRLVTGQNPASAKGVAQEVLQALEMSDVEERKNSGALSATSEGRGSKERTSNQDGDRASNGRVITPRADDSDISSRYEPGEDISQRKSESGHPMTKKQNERGLPSPELSSQRIEERESNSGRETSAAPKPVSLRASPVGYSGRIGGGAHLPPPAEKIAAMQEGVSTGNLDRTATPRGADDRLPSGMTADLRSEPNGLRDAVIGGHEDRRMDAPDDESSVLHDDLPRVKQQQAGRTMEQEQDSSEAASLQHKESERTDKASRTPRR